MLVIRVNNVNQIQNVQTFVFVEHCETWEKISKHNQMFTWPTLSTEYDVRYRGRIQLLLKKLRDSSVSSLIRAGWRQEEHLATQNLFQYSQG